jgi:hypothetical protein
MPMVASNFVFVRDTSGTAGASPSQCYCRARVQAGPYQAPPGSSPPTTMLVPAGSKAVGPISRRPHAGAV